MQDQSLVPYILQYSRKFWLFLPCRQLRLNGWDGQMSGDAGIWKFGPCIGVRWGWWWLDSALLPRLEVWSRHFFRWLITSYNSSHKMKWCPLNEAVQMPGWAPGPILAFRTSQRSLLCLPVMTVMLSLARLRWLWNSGWLKSTRSKYEFESTWHCHRGRAGECYKNHVH